MTEGKYDDKGGIAEMQARLAELQRENFEIKQSLKEIANANLLPGIVQNGFENVIAQLRPLRDLTPQRESVDPKIAAAVAAMLEAMKGVTLTGDSLGIPVVTVPFIGEPRPDHVPIVGKPPDDVPPTVTKRPARPGESNPDWLRTSDPSPGQPFRGGYRP